MKLCPDVRTSNSSFSLALESSYEGTLRDQEVLRSCRDTINYDNKRKKKEKKKERRFDAILTSFSIARLINWHKSSHSSNAN